MTKEAIEHYEAALKEAFPSGASGDVFHHWNEARKAQREWRGLTNEELIDLTAIYSGAPLYCAIEAKLKEKNT